MSGSSSVDSTRKLTAGAAILFVTVIAALWIIAPIMARKRVDQVRECLRRPGFLTSYDRCEYNLDDARWWWKLHPPHWFSDNP